MGRVLAAVGLALLLHAGAAVPTAQAQPDSTARAILEARGFPPDFAPRKALWRALALPGWGQFYNRQYYKIPFVWGGLGGGAYAVVAINNQYLLYREAALYRFGEERVESGEIDANPNAQFESEYNRITEQLGREAVPSRALRQRRDQFRRRRVIAIVALAAFYGLTVLDAYVNAHLVTFDVGETLQARVQLQWRGTQAGLRVRF